ncbi:D-glycero-beta-D-manno-heptose-7-phosphate kinase [Helicobacter sp. 23-1044]
MARILIIGDLMLDHYVWGSVERISPEAPVQILKITRENNRLGGASNVALNLIALGAEAHICGIIGDDSDGKVIMDLLDSSGINRDLLCVKGDFQSIKKTRFIASNQQVLRVDRESVDMSLDSAILEKIKDSLHKFSAIILSDYGKGALGVDFTKQIIALANEQKIPILCDPKGDDYSKYTNATLLTPNKKEAQIATNIRIDSPESLLRALKKLKNDYNLTYSIITLSEDGMAIYDDKMTQIPTLAKEVYDVTGAGDTVIATLAFGICHCADIYESAKLANAAAAVVVGKIGSAQANMNEIRAVMEDISDCFEVDDLKLIADLKKDGKKIVFTNGCFDILHFGHISYLRKAKSFGDILVVGLNSDDSVRRLKGDSRPINDESDRAQILKELECVDFVIIFDESTPLNLIKQIRPDILVKGADYKGKEVVGSEIVPDVRLVEFVEGKSTSKIAEKIQNA